MRYKRCSYLLIGVCFVDVLRLTVVNGRMRVQDA